MSDILIRNVDEAVVEQLEALRRESGRSFRLS